VPAAVRARLEAVLHRLPRVGLAAVSGGGDLASRWRLELASDGTARLEPGGVRLQPQRLGGAEFEHVVELLQLTDADPVAGPAWAAALPAGEPALADLPDPAQPSAEAPSLQDQDQDQNQNQNQDQNQNQNQDQDQDQEPEQAPAADAAPEVRLFGPVAVIGATGPEPVVIKDGRAVANHLGRATALVAFLSSKPQGATTEQVAAALSPVRRLSPATIWSLASRTRKWLGSAPDGTPYYPRTPDAGAHRLHPEVRTDWSRWLELVGHDAATTPVERLMAALDLVRGRPFDGVAERHYAWAEPLRQDMAAAVVDVAHEVARRCLAARDPVTARRACRVGRSVDPASELLWRDALRAEYLAGNRDAQRQLVEQLHVLADDLDADLEPETERLLAELDRRAAPAGV